MGGHVTYLVQSDAAVELEPWHGTLVSDPKRAPWAEVGGAAADLAWVETVVDMTGPPVQHRTWNLSAIWSVPTAGGDVWLKCVPPFFAHEVAVLRHLSGHSVPQVIAASGHRTLLAPMPGVDGYVANELEQSAMVEALVTIQADVAGQPAVVDTMLAAGVPDLRGDKLVQALTEVVDRRAPDDPDLRRLVDIAGGIVAEADAAGVPQTLVHGDAHPGNCRVATEPPLWFDWGDSFIGNPLLDLAAHNPFAPAIREHWVGLWADKSPNPGRVQRVWQHLRPVAQLRSAWVYQRFLDNIEVSEQRYHDDDVGQVLRAVAEYMRMLA